MYVFLQTNSPYLCGEHGLGEKEVEEFKRIIIKDEAWFRLVNSWNLYTLPETNIAPENRPFQQETNIPTIIFQLLC